MSKKKKNKKGLIFKSFTGIITALIISVVACVFFLSKPVDTNEEIVPFEVVEGASYNSVGSDLKEQGFIKSELYYKYCLKSADTSNLYVGKYPISTSMTVEEILAVISSGETYFPDGYLVTFREGKTMTQYAEIIAENSAHTVDEVYALLKDEAYLDELISTYWFITEEIKNPEIYYPLEGYLYPETYMFTDANMPIKEIFAMMLNQTESVLEEYKPDIESSGYTVHEILTLASIIEQEAGSSSDRAGVAGVFYNRLNDGWSLGSDVTTYYGVQVHMSERDLFMDELEEANAYNTRHESMAGKLPIGPVCNSSSSAIIACINPTISEYYYFVADKNGTTYFNTNEYDHAETVQKLQDEGLWYTYE